MKISPNINVINALIRITIGFTIVAWSTAKLVKRPWCNSSLIMAMLGGMKIGEGILRYCPLTAVYDQYGKNMVQKMKGNADSLEELDQQIPYNPS